MTRLTIGKLQISLEQGVARHSSKDMSIAAVEKELTEYQDFIEQWLQSVQTLSPSKPTPEEQELSRILRASAKDFKKAKFKKAFIATTLECIASLMRPQMKSLTEGQIKAIVADIISTL